MLDLVLSSDFVGVGRAVTDVSGLWGTLEQCCPLHFARHLPGLWRSVCECGDRFLDQGHLWLELMLGLNE